MKSACHDELRVAKDAALKAGRAILSHYSGPIDVTHKSPEQPLTKADLEANEILKTALSGAFPDDAWLSEEDADNPARLKKSRVWIVDPLDGTREFIDRNPEFAVSVALAVNGKPVVGVVYNPVTEELFWAGRGGGAFVSRGGGEAEKLAVTSNDGLSRIRLIVSRSESGRGEWRRFEPYFGITPVGGSAYKMALVAMGRADGSFTLDPKSEWDVCAGHLLVEEAGGVVTLADGEALAYNREKPRLRNLVYCNPHVHAYLLERIRNVVSNH